MNHSHATSERHGSQYIGIYWTYLSSRTETVTDERGRVRTFTTADAAEVAAWRAMQAAEDRIESLRLDPSQITRPTKPKSTAGRRAAANAVFKERAEA
jgi:hypothetical protein